MTRFDEVGGVFWWSKNEFLHSLTLQPTADEAVSLPVGRSVGQGDRPAVAELLR